LTQTPQRTAPIAPEHLLLRFGLVTLDQLNVALREQSATGTPFTDVLVRDGVVSASDLQRALGEAPAAEPEVAAEVALEPVPPVTVSAPAPQPQAPPVYVVRGNLVNGGEVEIAVVDEPAEAQQIALDAMRACARPAGSDWPVLNGRYVRPESIVSIDVSELVR
jgi:hypothetical protein